MERPRSSSVPLEPADITSLEGSTVDFMAIYRESLDYQLLTQSLAVLSSQLTQCCADLDVLHKLKTAALEDPLAFLDMLKSPEECVRRIPKAQTIVRLADIDTAKYTEGGRATRRSRDPQLELALATINDLQKRPSIVLPVLAVAADIFPMAELNSQCSNSSNFSSFLPSRSSSVVPSSMHTLREGFLRRVHSMPSSPASTSAVENTKLTMSTFGSLPALRASISPLSAAVASPVSANNVVGPIAAVAPSRSKEHAIMTSTSTSISTHTFAPKASTPPLPISYNLPWSDEEKRQLQVLLTQFPEEPVMARRYAKIAAAMGTRTAAQIGSHIAKANRKGLSYSVTGAGKRDVATKEAEDADGRHDEKDIKRTRLDPDCNLGRPSATPPAKSPATTLITPQTQSTIHVGYVCAACRMEPIVGVRWNCTVCAKGGDRMPKVSLCDDCAMHGSYANGPHKITHKLKRIERPSTRNSIALASSSTSARHV